MAARPSAMALPSASQAMALVAVVEESMPITKSPGMENKNPLVKNGGDFRHLRKFQGENSETSVGNSLVDGVGDGVHALLGIAAEILTRQQFAEIYRNLVV